VRTVHAAPLMAMARAQRVGRSVGMLGPVVRARLIAPLAPMRYLRMASAMRREGTSATVGFAASAQRCPDRPGLIDDLGTLTWKQLDERCDALAAALQEFVGPRTTTIAIMCRNHRGFIEALVAGHRIGADVVLLNTAFAGPALVDVVGREGVDTVIYDSEFADTVDLALAGRSNVHRIVAWTDGSADDGDVTIERLVAAHNGFHPSPKARNGRLILLTSGTTGAPKGARPTSGGGLGELSAVLERIPWRAEQTTVIAAPMFHAWGFSQLVFSALLSCTIVARRTFDPQATLALVDQHDATGLVVVPVMLDRIMELPDDVLDRFECRSLRFATASGSRMRSDVVVAFMDRFGDVVFNNYNATEAGMIAAATPSDLRAEPSTAGKPLQGTMVRILDADLNEVAPGAPGQIFVRSATLFDGYTSGAGRQFHEGFMASGDVGYVDERGRLFVVGRDDDMIVSGGENVYPIEVENVLIRHVAVSEAAAIGVDDEQFGQRLVAFVVLRDPESATEELLKRHVRDNLGNFKVPKQVVIVDELPRGSTGKILPAELRSRFGSK
jgi:acyl-CoA synthetase (AMP-forming)/AMP-acid ligase II